MTPETTRELLLAQHDRLREQIAACIRIAKLFASGLVPAGDLDLALEALRADFAVHNETETAAISRLLHGPAAWGSLLIDRMLDEHVAEHAAFWDLLTGTATEVAGRMEELAELLDAHMAAEERTFLSPATLREDVIRTRTLKNPGH